MDEPAKAIHGGWRIRALRSEPASGGDGGTPSSSEATEPEKPYLPKSVHELGGMSVLAGEVVRRAWRRPLDYGPEFVTQFRFAIRLATIPLLINVFAFSFGPIAVQGAGFLDLVGALDRLGTIFSTIVVRESAPLVVAIVGAGVIGTAMCADLGARKVREELDALSVLGVDTVKSLVVPRFLAMLAVCLLFNSAGLIAGIAGAVLVTIQHGAPLGPFFESFLSAASTAQLVGSYLKCLIFGAVIAVVCCYKGMAVSGGAEGVGRAVNQSVVIAFLATATINYVFTQAMLGLDPSLSEVR